ncbi:MAG TPA: hypothetical protein VG013_15840 [Gemmataceae bacterium]|jgi:hypothetical protein|nr:hypothetical protein [Gemmataceae bacterium]
MRRAAALLLLMLAGCSTAPVADLLDYFKPAQLEPGATAPYGNVGASTPIVAPVVVPAAPLPPPVLGAPGVAPPPGPPFIPPPPPGPGPGDLPPPRPVEPLPPGPTTAAPMSNDLSRPASAPSPDGPGVLAIPVR